MNATIHASQASQKYEYVGFWARFIAYCVDNFLLTLVVLAFMVAILGGAAMGGLFNAAGMMASGVEMQELVLAVDDDFPESDDPQTAVELFADPSESGLDAQGDPFGAGIGESADDSIGLADVIAVLLPFVLTIAFWIKWAATPGKMMLGAKIRDAKTLGPVPPARLVLRYVCYLVSFMPFMLGFLWAGFDRRKQGFHDKIAGTVVVRATLAETSE